MRNFEVFKYILVNQKNETLIFRNQVQLSYEYLQEISGNYKTSDFLKVSKMMTQKDKLINRNKTMFDIMHQHEESCEVCSEHSSDKTPEKRITDYYHNDLVDSKIMNEGG